MSLVKERPETHQSQEAPKKEQRPVAAKKVKLAPSSPSSRKETTLVGSLGMVLGVAAGAAFLGAAVGPVYALIFGVLGAVFGVYQLRRSA